MDPTVTSATPAAVANLPLSNINYWLILERISAIVSLVGVPYLVNNKRKSLPRLSFDFAGSSGESFKKDQREYYRFRFEGAIKNHSIETNTIQRIFLVVWRDKRKTDTRRFGFGGTVIKDSNGQQIKEPIKFDPKESKKLTIIFESIVEGTSDKELLAALTPIQPGSQYYLPKYRYELAFEDISGNLFDQNGFIKNRKTIDLKWTLPNTFESLRDGNPIPFIKHKTAIYFSDTFFQFRKLMRFLGL